MVVSIPATDSYGTLIGLEEDANANNGKDLHDDYPATRQSEDAAKEQRLPMLRPTHLLLPPPPAQTWKTPATIHTRPRLSLPRQQQQDCDYLSTTNNNKNDVDVYLQGIPSLQEQHRRLLRKGVVSYTAQSPERLVYVHQGEVAHAVVFSKDDNNSSSDCDILLSDKATTCHILALHSRPRLDDTPRHNNVMDAKNGSNNKAIITSLTHLDGCEYDQCLRDMIQEHKRQQASTNNSNTVVVVNMQLSIVGGFNDEKRHSQALSNWLLPLLADIADEEASWLQMTLQTCLISTMNTTTTLSNNDNNINKTAAAPLARGLAIDTRTGAIHLAEVTTMHLMGPHFLLRNARWWAMLYEQQDPNAIIIESTGENRRTLQCLHNGIRTATTAGAAAASSSMEIQPFYFEPLPPRKFHRLMNLTDAELLRETSSSPLVEDAGFCNRVRKTFLFMQQVGNSRHVFTGVSSGKNDRLGRHHHPRHHHQHHRHDHHPYHPHHHHHSHTGDHHKASSLFGEDGKFGRTRLFGGSGSSTVANNNCQYNNTTDTDGHRDQQQPLRFRRRRKPGRNNDWILVK